MPDQKYLFLYRSPQSPQGSSTGAEAPSPAKMQEMFAAFTSWKERFKDRIVDMGAKLKPGGKVLSASGVVDGPLVETKEVIGGYMIVTAGSYDGAVEVAHGMLGMMSPGARIEIREMSAP